jgi:YihY family inner membrane protein
VSTATSIRQTRGELEGDEALATLRHTGRRRLMVDSLQRFRAADGFSHSRALAFQVTLTLLPALIAVVGLAAALDQEEFRHVVQATVNSIAPGAAGEILTDALSQGSRSARRESSEIAMISGLAAALLSGASAMGLLERAANRVYGVERDRPFLRKYTVGLALALTAGVLGVLSVVALVGGTALRESVPWGAAIDSVWEIARWPLGATFAIGAVSILFWVSPRRKQPEPSWLAIGALASTVLWLALMGLLALYIDATDQFGATYGPIAGTIGVLLWAFLSSVALLTGLALAAQLEAVRAGITEPRVERQENE